jgi:hypothetical protein
VAGLWPGRVPKFVMAGLDPTTGQRRVYGAKIVHTLIIPRP